MFKAIENFNILSLHNKKPPYRIDFDVAAFFIRRNYLAYPRISQIICK